MTAASRCQRAYERIGADLADTVMPLGAVIGDAIGEDALKTGTLNRSHVIAWVLVTYHDLEVSPTCVHDAVLFAQGKRT